MLAARLVAERSYLRHFVASEQEDFTLWSDPYLFLTSVGFQLKRAYGDDLFPPLVALDVSGRVADVDVGGSTVGMEIVRLVAVPWHETNLRVHVAAKRIRGRATGVRINELVEDYRSIPLSAYRQIALVDPLIRLRRLRPEERVVIVLDGLSELRERAAEQPSIADALPRPADLRVLGNLTLLVFSRPRADLDTLTAPERRLDLGDARFAAENRRVIRAYVERELADAAVGEALADGGPPETLRDDLVRRADGNFLFLRHFFLGARAGAGPALLAGGLPGGLREIYARLLHRVVATVGEGDYLANHRPVLGALAASYAPLARVQLVRLAGRPDESVQRVLHDVPAFFDQTACDGDVVYRLYHDSFREFLLDEAGREEIWHVDEEAAHARIADAYFADGRTWELDPYAFDHLTDHLANGGPAAQQRLRELVDEPWRRLKRTRFRSNHSFRTDVDRASATLEGLAALVAVSEAVRLALLRSLVVDVEELMPKGAVEALVSVGQAQRALDHIAAMDDARLGGARIGEAISGFARLGPEGATTVASLVRDGLARARAAAEPQDVLLEMLPAVRTRDMLGAPELVRDIAIAVEAAPPGWWTGRLACHVARLMYPHHPIRARDWFAHAVDAADELKGELVDMLRTWATVDPGDAAAQITQLKLPAESDVAEALLAIGAGLERGGEADARAVWEGILFEQVLPSTSDPYETARALLAVARSRADDGDGVRAALEQALEPIERIGGDTDPKASLQDRASYRTTALIGAAEVARTAAPERCASLLRGVAVVAGALAPLRARVAA